MAARKLDAEQYRAALVILKTAIPSNSFVIGLMETKISLGVSLEDVIETALHEHRTLHSIGGGSGSDSTTEKKR